MVPQPHSKSVYLAPAVIRVSLNNSSVYRVVSIANGHAKICMYVSRDRETGTGRGQVPTAVDEQGTAAADPGGVVEFGRPPPHLPPVAPPIRRVKPPYITLN